MEIISTAYDIEWLGKTYTVVPFHDSRVVRIYETTYPKWRKKPKTNDIFFGHIELLNQMTELANRVEPNK